MKCPICNEEYQLTDSFCPNCGYEIHILPGNISDAAREYEETREKSYKKTWVALNESQADSQRLEAENSKIQQKFDEKEHELKDIVAQNEKLDIQLKALEEERNQLLSQITERKSTIQKLRDQIGDYLSLKKEKEDMKSKSNEWESKYNGLFADMSDAQRKISQIQSQLQSMTKEKEEWKSKSEEWESKYNSLFADMSEAQHKISQIKSKLKSVTEEKERLEGVLSKRNNSQTNNSNSTNPQTSSPQNRGERKGEVLFTDGQHEIKQGIYTGRNVYLAPQIMHSDYDGDLFTIIENNGVYTLYDNCGAVKKANGRAVREKGEQVTDGDIFCIGLIQIHIILPEIDFNSINF
jgi:DNA repair exonuclease SbcCD ATPase subunit